jgi:hypothetical protein
MTILLSYLVTSTAASGALLWVRMIRRRRTHFED